MENLIKLLINEKIIESESKNFNQKKSVAVAFYWIEKNLQLIFAKLSFCGRFLLNEVVAWNEGRGKFIELELENLSLKWREWGGSLRFKLSKAVSNVITNESQICIEMK